MPRPFIMTGIALILVGFGAYFLTMGTSAESIGHFIPAFTGGALVVLGLLSRKPENLRLTTAVGILVAAATMVPTGEQIIPAAQGAAGAVLDNPFITYAHAAAFFGSAILVVYMIPTLLRAASSESAPKA